MIKTFIINLDRRPDRLEKLNIPFEYNRFPAVDGRQLTPKERFRGIYGCQQSHIKLLEMLKLQENDVVMVFEDDVVLCDDFEKKLQLAMKELPETWDLLYIGGHNRGKTKLYSEHLLHVEKVWCTHAYIIRKKFIDILLLKIKARKWKVDVLFCDALPYGKCFMTTPLLAWQSGGYSDVENKVTENKHLYPTND